MGKIKALVVDDDKKFCTALGNCLHSCFGCEVSFSYSGSDAIRLIENEVFHIVLIDLKMPGINGFTVLEKAMEKYPDIIPIAITGVNEAGISDRVERMGAWFISKPVEFPALEYLLRNLLKEKKLI